MGVYEIWPRQKSEEILEDDLGFLETLWASLEAFFRLWERRVGGPLPNLFETCGFFSVLRSGKSQSLNTVVAKSTTIHPRKYGSQL